MDEEAEVRLVEEPGGVEDGTGAEGAEPGVGEPAELGAEPPIERIAGLTDARAGV